MRGIRIWHLAALVLSVPLLTAALPPGCYGGLNPNFVEAIGGEGRGASAIAPPKGYHVLGIFNHTAWDIRLPVVVTGNGGTWVRPWTFFQSGLSSHAWTWECDLQSLEVQDAEVDEIDATGATQTQTATYGGPVLNIGDLLHCGELVKARIVPTVPIPGRPGMFAIVSDPFATAATFPGLQYQVVVDLLSEETDPEQLP